jgi:hypothetical protein
MLLKSTIHAIQTICVMVHPRQLSGVTPGFAFQPKVYGYPAGHSSDKVRHTQFLTSDVAT